MTQLSLKVSPSMEIVRQGLQDLAAEIPKVGRLQIYQAALRAKTKLRLPGAKPSYPIKWDSEKQRRAFFATDGFGAGIPTSRTDKLVNAWQIVKITDGYSLVNATPYTKYVQGNAYGVLGSGIHSGRWKKFRDIVDEEMEKLPQEIDDAITIVARRDGF